MFVHSCVCDGLGFKKKEEKLILKMFRELQTSVDLFEYLISLVDVQGQ